MATDKEDLSEQRAAKAEDKSWSTGQRNNASRLVLGLVGAVATLLALFILPILGVVAAACGLSVAGLSAMKWHKQRQAKEIRQEQGLTPAKSEEKTLSEQDIEKQPANTNSLQAPNQSTLPATELKPAWLQQKEKSAQSSQQPTPTWDNLFRCPPSKEPGGFRGLGQNAGASAGPQRGGRG